MSEKIVKEWYEDDEHVSEMLKWNKGKLKQWEKQVVDRFSKGSRVLDVGCGLGREAFALSEMGFQVTGIDISDTIIDEVKRAASENHYEIPFYSYDGKTLPFDDRTFDVIIIWGESSFSSMCED